MDQRWLRYAQQDVGGGQEGDAASFIKKSKSTKGRKTVPSSHCAAGLETQETGNAVTSGKAR